MKPEPKKPKTENPAIIRRNTEKLAKLPMIKDSLDSVKTESRRMASSHKHVDYSKTNKHIDENIVI